MSVTSAAGPWLCLLRHTHVTGDQSLLHRALVVMAFWDMNMESL